MSSRILVVDGEDTVRKVIVQVLEAAGHDVAEAACGEDALQAYRERSFQVVITDIEMNVAGVDLLNEVRRLDPAALVVVMTKQASLSSATSALRAGAYDYLTKPFASPDDIVHVVDRALQKKRLEDDNQSLMQQLRRKADELKDVNSQLRELAIRDDATDLHNHRHFRLALENEIARAHRFAGTFSLIFLDVDHFKQFNDTHGHLAGDTFLHALASLLKQGQRETTTIARYGGEEFVLMLPGTPKQGALILADAIRSRVETHPFEGRESQPGGAVTISAGVATFPDDGADSNALIEAADRALYQAKNAGRNRVASPDYCNQSRG